MVALSAMVTVTAAGCDGSNEQTIDNARRDEGGGDDDDDDEGSEDDDPSSGSGGPMPALPSETADGDASAPDDDDDDGVIGTDCENEYCVTEIDDPGAVWKCEGRQHSCMEDYLAFPSLAEPFAHPISEAALERQINEILKGDVPTRTKAIAPEALAGLLTDAMNVGFLRDGINKRPLTVTQTYAIETETYRERELLFTDPYVGTFKGLLLTPLGDGPHPAVIALHGHWDTPESYRDFNGGADFPQRGLAILILAVRVFGADENEDLVTRIMLRSGFSMMAIRHYETLLGLRYLQYRENVDNDRIGLIGHSGGSVASNLTIRLEPAFRAYVSDCEGIYFNIGLDGLLIDETTPALYPFYPLINDFATSPRPVLDVPYGYAGEVDAIFAFFTDRLS
ncbi:MAG: hypothetical protein M5R36_08615 [Deltaproteobacteria bacterium]|nr:hypothetical protein [Deltaproteobacteria bacterium]